MRRRDIDERNTIFRQLLNFQSVFIDGDGKQFGVIAFEERCRPLVARILRGNQCSFLYEQAASQVKAFLRSSGNDYLISGYADSRGRCPSGLR